MVNQRNTILPTFRASPPTGKGGSDHKVALIPKRNRSFVAREPVSPTVSCFGQVKSTENKKRSVCVRKPKQQASNDLPFAEQIRNKVLLRGIKRGHGHASDGGHDTSDGGHGPVADEIVAPSLQKMRHFANGRGTLSDFDCRAYEEKGVKRKRT